MAEFYDTNLDLESKSRSDLEPVLLGFESCAPGHDYGPTVRPFHLLHFVTAGKGSLQIAGQTFELTSGDVFFIPAGQISYYRASQNDPWRYSWMGFTGIRGELYAQQFLTMASERYVLRGLDTGKYAALIARVADAEEANAANHLLACSVLNEIFYNLVSDLSAPGCESYAPSLADRIKYYLDIKYYENLRIRDVAAHFGVHPNYLSRLFRNTFGVSPKKYILELKFKKAANMLETTAQPIAIIAASLGFDDQLAFSRGFKSVYNRSPQSYRAAASTRQNLTDGEPER